MLTMMPSMGTIDDEMRLTDYPASTDDLETDEK